MIGLVTPGTDSDVNERTPDSLGTQNAEYERPCESGICGRWVGTCAQITQFGAGDGVIRVLARAGAAR